MRELRFDSTVIISSANFFSLLTFIILLLINWRRKCSFYMFAENLRIQHALNDSLIIYLHVYTNMYDFLSSRKDCDLLQSEQILPGVYRMLGKSREI